MLPHLSPRLSLIASLVPQGAKVCDVGTDHGLLPAYLYLKGEVSSVCATDINLSPLERAKKTVARYGADGIKLLLCDGLEGISENDADTVIIAGMGGEVISGIIKRCSFSKNKATTFIFQPMTGADELRKYLAQNGFDVIAEPAVCEHGKVWSVMLVRFDGKVRSIDHITQLIGKVTAETPEGAAYIRKQYERSLKCAESLKTVQERQAEYVRWRDTAETLKNILEDRHGF